MAQYDHSRLEGRTGEVWQMYAVRSMTQQAIAEKLGISQSNVSRIVRDARESIPRQTREEIARERAEQLLAVTEAVMPAALAGEPQAIAAVLKLQEREAKLLGLDNPTRTEVDAVVNYRMVGVDPEDLT